MCFNEGKFANIHVTILIIVIKIVAYSKAYTQTDMQTDEDSMTALADLPDQLKSCISPHITLK